MNNIFAGIVFAVIVIGLGVAYKTFENRLDCIDTINYGEFPTSTHGIIYCFYKDDKYPRKINLNMFAKN